MSLSINFGPVGIYNEDFPSTNSPDFLIMWSFKVTKNTLSAVSLLPQGYCPVNLARLHLTIRNFDPLIL